MPIIGGKLNLDKITFLDSCKKYLFFISTN